MCSFITDYINYTLAKSLVPNMYIVRGVGFWQIGLKNRFSPYRPKHFRPKKHNNNKALKNQALQLLFNRFCCDINNKK